MIMDRLGGFRTEGNGGDGQFMDYILGRPRRQTDRTRWAREAAAEERGSKNG